LSNDRLSARKLLAQFSPSSSRAAASMFRICSAIVARPPLIRSMSRSAAKGSIGLPRAGDDLREHAAGPRRGCASVDGSDVGDDAFVVIGVERGDGPHEQLPRGKR
jgi:hypothetical protein